LIEDELKIAHYFSDLIISSEVKMVKPEKDIFNLAIGRSGSNPEEILFVDDRQENIDSAKEVGLKAIHFQSNTQVIKEVNKNLEITLP
jgi:HAD superfamily hydrolase (TIGR01509 family)